MKKKIVWSVLSYLILATLLLASCAPATTPAKPTTPVAPATPAAPATPTRPQTPAAPTTSSPATTDKPRYGGTIAAVTPQFSYMDTYRYEFYSMMTTGMCAETLAIIDWGIDRNVFDFPDARGGKGPLKYLKGGALEGWNMPDAQTLVFHVRKGVQWQNKPPVNGREFTADDIVWNMQRYGKSPFLDHNHIDQTASITKIDKYTVNVKFKPELNMTLTEAVRGLLAHYSFQMWPQEAVGKSGEIEDWHNLIGTGPFVLTDFVSDSGLTFVRNPNYYGFDERNLQNKLPYADLAKMLIIADPSTRFAALRSGKIDRLWEVEWQDGQSVVKSTPRLLYKGKPAASPKLFRMRTDMAPFTDVRVRQAMNMALDRNEIVKTFFGGYATYYSAMLDPTFGSLYTPYEKLPDKPIWTTVSCKEILTYNPEKAKKLLAEAGYPNGFKTHVDTSSLKDPGVSEILQSYLAKIGIQAQINVMEDSAYNAVRFGKKHTAIILYWNSMNPNPFHQLLFVANPEHQYNMSTVDDPVFYDLYKKGVRETDETKQNEILKQLEYYHLEHAFYIPFPHYQQITLWQPWLKGYAGEGPPGTGEGTLLSRLWVDQAQKKSLGF